MAYKDKEKHNECNRRYRLKNKEWISKKNKIYREKNKELIAKTDKIYKEKNKEWIRKKDKIYREKNKELIAKRAKVCNSKRKELRNKQRTIRRQNDPNYKLLETLRKRMWDALKGNNKSARTMELIGCTVEELWSHVEKNFKSGMTKENHGLWHLDHIMPCCKFDLTDPVQQRECFHYTNLQPLWAYDNYSKGKKIISRDITSSKT